MDEDDPGQSRRGGGEDPPDDDSNEAGDENPSTVPKPKARTKVTNQPHKGKPKHPNFLIEGPASGGSTSISARPTRKEKTLASASFHMHWDRVGRTSGSSWVAVYSNWRTTTKAASTLEDVPLSTQHVSCWTASLHECLVPSCGRSLPSAPKAGMPCDSHTSITTPPHQPTVPHRRPLCLQTWCGNTSDAA